MEKRLDVAEDQWLIESVFPSIKKLIVWKSNLIEEKKTLIRFFLLQSIRKSFIISWIDFRLIYLFEFEYK